ncbi:MAG: GTPase HflX [Proteobacteria bacterium]|nr:GTPase HflX [Desulfobacteraceae bacterium]MBU3980166.1 GTPase HflX [Pseudomonadota bacterium]MBU4013290.1 GTPase HflX [Pseudomonadota bacterium]MBU4068806.1 GTPase HflX [Pseudomonadota bacterium]MBU4101360.1 GTPase HflX [Pseudomonadota bacterium]
MKRLFGNTSGLKANQIQSLENFYRHRIPDKFLITPGLAADISRLSLEIRRQIGLLVNRQGRIAFVIVGSHHGIVIPDISEYRVAPGRLKGLRCIHTHLKKEPLTNDDFNDLVLLRLDIMAVITLTKDGLPYQVHASHIIPTSKDEKLYQMLGPLNPNQLDIGCLELIQALESELSHATSSYKANQGEEKALLVSVTTASRRKAIDSLEELKELAASNGIEIAGTVLQQRKKSDSRFLLGPGKLQELTIETLQKGATLLIFDQELNPSQIRSITNHIDLKVIDRTQLILDIFAQRAQTKEGKIQVGLAQLKYLLPRLITKNTAMSRLTGGIGGRGPGETKLEINRRRVRDSIARFEKALLNIKKQRKHQKAKRSKKGLPVISIIGYTNSGKSTLLNTLTKSNVLAESRLFATLDPSSRRLKFPKDTEVIITDTVGFIKDLPKDLMVAFRATLEELESADLLLHVIDISSPRFKDQIKSVEKILSDLNLHNIPLIRVLNKQDLVDMETISRLSIDLDGTPISAINRSTLMPLIEKMENAIQHLRKFY